MKSALKEGDIIRNKKTGKPLMVIWINHVCLFVIDLQEPEELRHMMILLQKDYCRYTNDLQMECKKVHEVYNESIKNWTYKPVYLK